MTPVTSLLIVDDEPGIRTLVARWAEARGFSVAEAACAGDALDSMATHPAAIALCDVTMPDRDGYWLAAQLHQQFPETAIVMITGLCEEERPAASPGATIAHLSKPFSRQQLIDVLEKAIDWHMERLAAEVWEKTKAV